MTLTVQAIYEEDNLIRLLSPLPLKKGDQVEVTVNSPLLAELERNAPDPRRAAELLAEIAAMPIEPEPSEFVGTEDDRTAALTDIPAPERRDAAYLLTLPGAERHRILAEAAESAAPEYEADLALPVAERELTAFA